MANEREKIDRSVPLPITTEQRADSDDPDRLETSDPADEIPVPIAMSAAEIDERAQAVEAVRGTDVPATAAESLDEPTIDEDRIDS